ncbi:MAG TPA: hypothetical protein VMJ34_17970 [Bryobacteraceae bacterium]|nr:hypothetical protein [Bryobacteraceae bacterium]
MIRGAAVIAVAIVSCAVSVSSLEPPSRDASATEPVDACKVFRDPDQHKGLIHLHAVYVYFVEDAFLIPYPKCEEASAWIALAKGTDHVNVAWGKGPPGFGVWMLSDLTGTLTRNRNGGFLFMMESLKLLRRVKPYPIK